MCDVPSIAIIIIIIIIIITIQMNLAGASDCFPLLCGQPMRCGNFRKQPNCTVVSAYYRLSRGLC